MNDKDNRPNEIAYIPISKLLMLLLRTQILCNFAEKIEYDTSEIYLKRIGM